MLGGGNEKGGGGGGDGGGGEPDLEMLISLMRILQKEESIRSQTRALEAVRETSKRYAYKATFLADEQRALQNDLDKLNAKVQCAQVNELLGQASRAMADAAGLLAKPQTDVETVAAETAVIELLTSSCSSCSSQMSGSSVALANQMMQMMGLSIGQSVGSSPGGGSNAGGTTSMATDGAGGGDSRGGAVSDRTPERHSGKFFKRDLPVEFRDALEAYYRALEEMQ
jgi:hypothetical protein